MDEILKIDTIDRYNKLFGFETRHPLVLFRSWAWSGSTRPKVRETTG